MSVSVPWGSREKFDEAIEGLVVEIGYKDTLALVDEYSTLQAGTLTIDEGNPRRLVSVEALDSVGDYIRGAQSDLDDAAAELEDLYRTIYKKE